MFFKCFFDILDPIFVYYHVIICKRDNFALRFLYPSVTSMGDPPFFLEYISYF